MTESNVKKRGLGRGLDALFRDVKKENARGGQEATQNTTPESAAVYDVKRAAEIAGQVAANAVSQSPRKVMIDRLTPGKFQPRSHFDEAALAQLAESIAAHGVVQPLLVRPLSGGRYEIIAGERRWRAAQKARVHEVPVVVQELSDAAAFEIALIENLQREDLSPIEEAEGYQRLMEEFSQTQETISRQLGKSRSHVANTLRLLKLPESVRAMVRSGTLSAGHARALIGVADPASLAGIILKRSLSVRQTEKLVQQTQDGKVKPKLKKIKTFVQKDVDTQALERKMTDILGMTVTIENTGATSGKLVIDYKSFDQLDDILKRLSARPKTQ